MNIKERNMTTFKTWYIVMGVLVLIFGLILFINSVSNNLYNQLTQEEFAHPLAQLLIKSWWMELFTSILILGSAIISFILFFNRKKLSFSIDLLVEGIVLWPLCNLIEGFYLSDFAKEYGAKLPALILIGMILCGAAVILGIIASIRKIFEDTRKKIAVASFIVSAIGILFFLFEGDVEGLALVANIYFIAICVADTIYFIKYNDKFDYYLNMSTTVLNKAEKDEETYNNPFKSFENKIEQLNELKEKGLITEEEYNKKRADFFEKL